MSLPLPFDPVRRDRPMQDPYMGSCIDCGLRNRPTDGARCHVCAYDWPMAAREPATQRLAVCAWCGLGMCVASGIHACARCAGDVADW